MLTLKGSLICLILTTCTSAMWGQRTFRPGVPGAVGFMDPVTGEFRSVIVNPDVDATALAAAVPVTGQFVFNFTITIKSTLPATDILICNASASTADVGSFANHTESGQVAATKSGTTAKCTVTLPYSWALSTVAQDRVTLEYGVTTAPPNASGNPLPSRQSEHGLGSIAVPANGATTTETVAVTL